MPKDRKTKMSPILLKLPGALKRELDNMRGDNMSRQAALLRIIEYALPRIKAVEPGRLIFDEAAK